MPKVLVGKMDDRHKLGAFNILLLMFFLKHLNILNAQSRSSPSIHICLYIEILP